MRSRRGRKPAAARRPRSSSLDGVPCLFPRRWSGLPSCRARQPRSGSTGRGPSPCGTRSTRSSASFARRCGKAPRRGPKRRSATSCSRWSTSPASCTSTPALALHRTNVKFERRFREVERRLAAGGTAPGGGGTPAHGCAVESGQVRGISLRRCGIRLRRCRRARLRGSDARLRRRAAQRVEVGDGLLAASRGPRGEPSRGACPPRSRRLHCLPDGKAR